MPDRENPAPPAFDAVTNPPVREGSTACPSGSTVDKMMCERCGRAEMFRMHAVWRCPACGYKTDCCGW